MKDGTISRQEAIATVCNITDEIDGAEDIGDKIMIALGDLPSVSTGNTNRCDLISREWLKTAIHNFYYGLKHIPTEEDIQAYIDAAPSVSCSENPNRCEDAISRSDAIRVASGYCHWSNIPKELAKLLSVNPIPCDDVISRQAALDIVNSYSESQSNVEDVTQDIISDIVVLPSVSTEKTGRWHRKYDSIVNDYFWECDNCKCGFQRDYPYCPNCGAKMQEVE